jgi:hypothetical protein
MFDILLVFIALKWTGAVDWSWGITLIPLWVGIIKEIVVWLICEWLDISI